MADEMNDDAAAEDTGAPAAAPEAEEAEQGTEAV
jgi:hypothetical protein